MPYQAEVYVGKIICSIHDIEETFKHFGKPLTKCFLDRLKNDWCLLEQEIEEEEIEPIFLKIEGKSFPIKIDTDCESGIEFLSVYNTNTKTGQKGDTNFLLGAELTSKYIPTLLDIGWECGMPDPFVLDLDRLQKIREEVKKQWPEAEILMMTVFH